VKPLLKVRVADGNQYEAFLEGFDYTTTTNAAAVTMEKAELAPIGTYVCYLIIHADDSNSGTVYIGGAGATFPLVKTDPPVNVQLPDRNVLDLSKVSVSGRGTASQVVHFLFVRVSPVGGKN
jgi:hypothetical protein